MIQNYSIPTEKNSPQDYYWFRHGFSKSDLVRLSDALESIPFNQGTTFGSNDDNIRKSRIKWLPQDSRFEWLYDLMIPMAQEANRERWGFEIHSVLEQIQYTEYLAEDAGHYTWHQDIGPDNVSKRKISITIQLSDSGEYEGGDLQIWRGGDAYDNCPRGIGAAVLFPSYMMHRVTPITKGIRKSLVLWIGGSHYK